MGANKDKKPRKKRAKTPKEPLTAEQKGMLVETGNALDDAIDAITAAGTISRQFSLARTRLEEAEMWLERGFEEMGYALDDDEDDEDADADADADKSEEEEE
jgi:ribosome assembly protein YihI (activator of Der GTPase)